jgi:hypothetical protein
LNYSGYHKLDYKNNDLFLPFSLEIRGMITRFIFLPIIITLLLSTGSSFAQVHSNIEQMEDSLKLLSMRIQKAENDSVRLFLNFKFHEKLSQTLLLSGSFDYPFDSLKTISKLTSPDKKFRIYTWNLPKGDGTNLYFGFIQLNPKKKLKCSVHELFDRSDSIPRPEITILNNRSWYGSLYYKIVMTTFNNQKFYTLLGLNGLNLQLSQRIIDVLFFDKTDQPQFGAKIFRNYRGDSLYRVIFKYSSSASMVLTYDDQYLIINKKWNSSRKQFESERKKASMIVCDELIPLDSQFEGRFEYYVPSSEIYNGFVFKKGYWYFYKNVDVRNKRH